MSARSRGDIETEQNEAAANDGLRLDKWLWQARFFKSRSLAATVAGKGKVRINRTLVTKAHYRVRPGDVLTFAQGHEIRVVRILALGERRGPAVEAQALYEDIGETPCAQNSSQEPAEPGTAPSQKREPWGVKGGIDPRRARRQAIDAKMNGR